MAVGARGIAQQQAQLLAIGQQPKAFATGQQHPLRTAHRTEAIGAPAAMRRIEVGIRGERPGTQSSTAWRLHQPAAILDALARRDVGLPRRGIESQAFGQRRDDMVADTLWTAAGTELSPHRAPIPFEIPVLAVGQQSQPGQLCGQFKANERFRQRRSGECAVTQIEGHADADGTSISMPIRRRTGGRQRRACRMLHAAALEQLDGTVRLAPSCRRIVGVGREGRQPVQRCGQQSPIRAIRGCAKQIARLRHECTADVIGTPAQPVLQVARFALGLSVDDPP